MSLNTLLVRLAAVATAVWVLFSNHLPPGLRLEAAALLLLALLLDVTGVLDELLPGSRV